MDALRSAATAPWVQSLALLCLCAAYLQGGVDKARNFRGAVAEMRQFGLAPAVPIAAATIALQLGASALIVSGWYRWAGALALAAFTVAAAFLADRFWAAPQADRQRTANAFFEHWAWLAACCSSSGTTWEATVPDNKTTTNNTSGSFAPLAIPVFAVLWAATVLGNIGSFMRDVASAWMVTELSSSPTAVALIQTAATLPVFLLAIPAGVLSDILDRRRFLIGVQVLLGAVSGTLLVLAQTNTLTVEYLVALTFVGGIGAALMGPTWQSIVPELVPRSELKSAVALNSLGINIARAIGPAAGGLLLASFGAAAAYGLDVLSYVFVIAALIWWKRPKAEASALNEQFFGAFRAGVRYARASRELHVVLLRAAVFFLFASAVWALLPLVARRMLGGTAGFYGVMLGAVGAGAILGAVLLPKLRKRLDTDGLVLLASVITAAVMAVLTQAPPQWLAVALMLVLGLGWILALTTLNGVAQAVLPNWVRGRGLAIYLMVFNGAMALGSLGWGLIAGQMGLPVTLLIGAVGLVLVSLVFHRIKLPTGEADLQPSNHWPEPLLAEPVAHDRGPVMIQIEYRIAREDLSAFLQAMQQVAHERRRDGAYAWGVAEHTGEPGRVIEWFLVESWAEHLRQHGRVSKADADLQAAALRYHQGPDKPVVHHFLSLNGRSTQAGPGVSLH